MVRTGQFARCLVQGALFGGQVPRLQAGGEAVGSIQRLFRQHDVFQWPVLDVGDARRTGGGVDDATALGERRLGLLAHGMYGLGEGVIGIGCLAVVGLHLLAGGAQAWAGGMFIAAPGMGVAFAGEAQVDPAEDDLPAAHLACQGQRQVGHRRPDIG